MKDESGKMKKEKRSNRDRVRARESRAQQRGCASLAAAYRSRPGFGAKVVLLTRAAAATDGSDHFSSGDKRDRSNARQSLSA